MVSDRCGGWRFLQLPMKNDSRLSLLSFIFDFTGTTSLVLCGPSPPVVRWSAPIGHLQGFTQVAGAQLVSMVMIFVTEDL